MNKQSGGTWGKDGFNRNRVNALGLDNRGLALYNSNNSVELPQVEARGEGGSFVNDEQPFLDTQAPDGEVQQGYVSGNRSSELVDGS